jgi:DNA-binding response OmpR family regulator
VSTTTFALDEAIKQLSEDEPADIPSRDNQIILLAENDTTTATLISYRLERENFKLFHAHTGSEALELAWITNPDLIILNTKLPEINGFEVLNQLRQDVRHEVTPIIVMTAMADDQTMLRSFELGADDLMTIPFSPLELAVRINRLVRPRVGVGL